MKPWWNLCQILSQIENSTSLPQLREVEVTIFPGTCYRGLLLFHWLLAMQHDASYIGAVLPLHLKFTRKYPHYRNMFLMYLFKSQIAKIEMYHLSVGKTKNFKLILALQENWSGILVTTVPGRGGKNIAEMHQYQVKGLVFDDHFEDETFHRRTVVRLGDLDFKPFTAPTLIKSVNFAHRNHRAKGGAQSTWTAVLLLFRCKTHVLQALLQGVQGFFPCETFCRKAFKISSPADSLIPLRKANNFFQLNLFYQNVLQK